MEKTKYPALLDMGPPPAFLSDMNNMFQTLEILWGQHAFASDRLSEILPTLEKHPAYETVRAVIQHLVPMRPLWLPSLPMAELLKPPSD